MIDARNSDEGHDRAMAAHASRWTAAAALALMLHGAAVWFAWDWAQAAAAGDPPTMVMIELAALPSAPDVPQHDVAPGPLAPDAQEHSEPEPETPPPEQVESFALPNIPNPEVSLPPPAPKPVPKAVEAEVRKPVETKKPVEKKQKQKASQASAPRAERQLRVDRAAAPSSSSAQAPSMSSATWRSQVMGHLERFKRSVPASAAAGVAQVTFTIDRSGRVLSARLMKSSGSAVVDAEAAAIPRRASPVPAPPTEMAGSSIPINVPIRF